MIGRFFRQGTKQFYSIRGKQFRIESTEKWYKKANYKIINEQNNERVGEYILAYPYNDTIYHYPDVPYTNPYLKVVKNEREFEFRRLKPEVAYWLFDSTTWGHYSFGLYDKENECVVKYSFNIEKPLSDGSIIFNNNLEGSIESDESNLLLSFAGIFLLERFFDDQHKSG
ncbi:MAG: hypothetical protein ABJB11_10930 [Ferruginibacter sp.]